MEPNEGCATTIEVVDESQRGGSLSTSEGLGSRGRRSSPTVVNLGAGDGISPGRDGLTFTAGHVGTRVGGGCSRVSYPCSAKRRAVEPRKGDRGSGTPYRDFARLASGKIPEVFGMAGPLAGVKVIELAAPGALPLGTLKLADMGADVIRIDRLDNVPDVRRRETFHQLILG